MTGAELKAFRKMVGLSQSQMATMLGYGKRAYQMMERDMVEIRHGVGLACAAFALGIRDYNGPQVEQEYLKRKEMIK